MAWDGIMDADGGTVVEETSSAREKDRSGDGEGQRVHQTQEQKRLISAPDHIWCVRTLMKCFAKPLMIGTQL